MTGKMTNPLRRSLPGQQAPEQRRYSRLFVPANSNGASVAKVLLAQEVGDLHQGSFVETPQALDAALPFLIMVFLAAAIAVELLVVLPITREGLRGLTVLLH